jgi:hypothetical protein
LRSEIRAIHNNKAKPRLRDPYGINKIVKGPAGFHNVHAFGIPADFCDYSITGSLE